MAATATDSRSSDSLVNMNNNDIGNPSRHPKVEKLHSKKDQQNTFPSNTVSKKVNTSTSKDKDLDRDPGWNKVRSKSDRYESRGSSHGFAAGGHDRYRGSSRRNPSYRGYSRKPGPVKDRPPFNSTTHSGVEVNGGNIDSNSSGDSADSDSKKGDAESKSKSEFVAAPIPKTNPWSKPESAANESPANNSIEKPLDKKANNRTIDEKSTSSNKSQKLPVNCEWGKSSDKEKVHDVEEGINNGQKKEQETTKNVADSSSVDQVTKKNQSMGKPKDGWPSLKEASSPLQTKSPIQKRLPPKSPLQNNVDSKSGTDREESKKKNKHIRSSYRASPKIRQNYKKDVVDSDSSKDDHADEHLSPSTPNSRKKERHKWVPLPVDVRSSRRGSRGGYHRSGSPGRNRHSRYSDDGSRGFNLVAD